jgi:Fe-S-cluster containining protein
MILIVGRCPWVEKNHTCAAYEARPWICRLIGAPNYPCHKQPGGEEKINAVYRKYRPSKAL